MRVLLSRLFHRPSSRKTHHLELVNSSFCCTTCCARVPNHFCMFVLSFIFFSFWPLAVHGSVRKCCARQRPTLAMTPIVSLPERAVVLHQSLILIPHLARHLCQKKRVPLGDSYPNSSAKRPHSMAMRSSSTDCSAMEESKPLTLPIRTGGSCMTDGYEF